MKGNKITGRPIIVNDLVFIPNKGNSKLDKLFVGPFKVIEVLPYNNVLLDNGYQFHMNQIRISGVDTIFCGSVEESENQVSVIGASLDCTAAVTQTTMAANGLEERCIKWGLNRDQTQITLDK